MKSFYTWCPCHNEIGLTDGAVLIIGLFEVRAPLTVWCSCGAATHWRPVRRRVESAPVPQFRAICYTEAVEV